MCREERHGGSFEVRAGTSQASLSAVSGKVLFCGFICIVGQLVAVNISTMRSVRCVVKGAYGGGGSQREAGMVRSVVTMTHITTCDTMLVDGVKIQLTAMVSEET